MGRQIKIKRKKQRRLFFLALLGFLFQWQKGTDKNNIHPFIHIYLCICFFFIWALQWFHMATNHSWFSLGGVGGWRCVCVGQRRIRGGGSLLVGYRLVWNHSGTQRTVGRELTFTLIRQAKYCFYDESLLSTPIPRSVPDFPRVRRKEKETSYLQNGSWRKKKTLRC